jgi:hypothetical protein
MGCTTFPMSLSHSMCCSLSRRCSGMMLFVRQRGSEKNELAVAHLVMVETAGLGKWARIRNRSARGKRSAEVPSFCAAPAGGRFVACRRVIKPLSILQLRGTSTPFPSSLPKLDTRPKPHDIPGNHSQSTRDITVEFARLNHLDTHLHHVVPHSSRESLPPR